MNASSQTQTTYQLGSRTVHRIGYGAMQPAGRAAFGPPKDRAAALAVLREAVESGVRLPVAFLPIFPRISPRLPGHSQMRGMLRSITVFGYHGGGTFPPFPRTQESTT